MKNLFLLLAVTIISLSFISCKKDKTNCAVIPAKILRFDCDRVILQLLTTDIIGDSSWTDVPTGQQYSNVISNYNTCAISSLTNGQTRTIYVNIGEGTPLPPGSPCSQCMGLSVYPPHTVVDFTNISLNTCD